MINGALEVEVRRDQVVGAYAGLRPLLDTGDTTADLSRKHAVLVSASGVVTVVGGKLTTYRRMAQDAVDRAVQESALPAGPCRTRRLPLLGAASPRRARRVEAPPRLLRRFGTEAPAVLAEAVAAPAWTTRSCSPRWPPASPRRSRSWSSGSPTRARGPSRTCSTGVPGSGWCRRTGSCACRAAERALNWRLVLG